MAKFLARDFFEENKDERPHELIKRVMYKKYLQAYIPVTQKYYSTVIIDGFAGPGRYGRGRPTTIEEYGSPIIALIVAVGYLAKTHRGIEIDLAFEPNLEIKVEKRHTLESKSNAAITLYFVEDDKQNFRSLCENAMVVFNSFLYQIEGAKCFMEHGMAAYQFYIPLEQPGSEIVLTCNIQKMAFQDFTPPEIDTEITRCFTFLDPFGYTHTPMNVVQKYVGEGKEVLINFMSSYVNRFVSRNPGGVAELFGIDTKHIKKVAQQAGKSKEEVDDIIADFVKDFIRESPVEAQKENNSVKNITKNFEEVLRRKAGSDYSLIFEMSGKINAIIYHLVFITNHIKGVKEMKESMNRCTQEGDRLSVSDYKIVRLGHKLSLKNDQNPGDVANAIFKEFKGRRVELQNIETFVLLDTPYLFRKKVLKLMEEEEHPRLCQVRNVDHWTTRDRKAGTFPDWGTWELQFRVDDEEQDREFIRSM